MGRSSTLPPLPRTLPPTGTVALVFTDLEGSTRLWEEMGDGFLVLLQRHHQLIRSSLSHCGGYEVKTEGDAFMVSFHSPDAALRFCRLAQNALRAEPWPVPLRVRMGLHWATPLAGMDPVSGRMDYHGPEVNRAARVASAAHGGQVLISDPAARALQDADLVDLGLYRLRGFAEAERIWSLPGDFPPIRAETLRRTNLEAPTTSFVGRRAEMQALHTALGRHRMVTVLGFGGVGKTRLASEYARLQADVLGGGSWLCGLDGVTDVEGLCRVVGEVLGVPLQADPEEQLGHALAGRGQTLLVLDNFEQISQHAPALQRWLTRAPELRILVTSRHRLGIPAETVLPLEPLSVSSEAVRLFEERARAVNPHFSADPAVLQKLVSLLDGLPLAIELAAARAKLLTDAQLLGRLSRSMDLLQNRGARDRQATLQGALQWSWDLLERPERRALSRLSIFEGSFSVEGAEALLGEEALERLEGLLDRSLLLRRGERFGMLECVRQFAAERLEEKAEVEGHYFRWFARFGSPEYLKTLRAEEGPARLRPEWQDLLAVARRGPPEEAAAAALAASELFELQGPFSPGVGLLRQQQMRTPSLKMREARLCWLAGRMEEARKILEEMEPPTDTAQRANWQTCRGVLAQKEGRVPQAQALFHQALALFRQVPDPVGEALVLGNLAGLEREQGRHREAQAGYLEALELHRVHSPRFMAVILVNLGVIHLEQGDLEVARNRLVEALERSQRLGDRRVEGSIRGSMGILRREQGRFEEAQECFTEALRIHRELGNRRVEGTTLGSLGELYRVEGKPALAEATLHAALLIHREQLNRRFEAITLNNLGELEEGRGELSMADACYVEALGLARQVRDRRIEGVILGQLGILREDPTILAKGFALLESVGDQQELRRLRAKMVR